MGEGSKCDGAITCKGIVCWGPGEGFKVEEIQVDAPKASEVRIKMIYASVCHSDFIIMHGYPNPHHAFPRALSHEGVGFLPSTNKGIFGFNLNYISGKEVESVGESVTSAKRGDIVIASYLSECGECSNCNASSRPTNFYMKYPPLLGGLMPDGTSRMRVQGKELHGFLGSTWTQYMVTHVAYVVKIDPRLPLPHASFLSCGFSTGLGAAWFDARVDKGSTVAVLGLVAVGLGAIQGAQIQGASSIFGIDRNPLKREKGEAYRMTHFINPDEAAGKSISELVMEFTAGEGVDYCFECTGVLALVTQAVQSTKPGEGVAVGIGAGGLQMTEVDTLSLLTGRTLKGSIFEGVKIHSHFPMIVQKCLNKEIQLDHFLTHEISFDEMDTALELVKRPDCVKVLIKM